MRVIVDFYSKYENKEKGTSYTFVDCRNADSGTDPKYGLGFQHLPRVILPGVNHEFEIGEEYEASTETRIMNGQMVLRINGLSPVRSK